MFLIIKSSRSYNGGPHGYTGPTWAQAGLKPGSFNKRELAEVVAAKLTACNPVGFDVVEQVDLPENGSVVLPSAWGTRTVTFKNGERVREVIVAEDGAETQLFPIPAHLQELIERSRA